MSEGQIKVGDSVFIKATVQDVSWTGGITVRAGAAGSSQFFVRMDEIWKPTASWPKPDLFPVLINREDTGHFRVEAGDKQAIGLGFGEMLETVTKLALPGQHLVPHLIPKPEPEPPPARTHVLVSIPVEDARAISDGLADVLCWLCGYMAGQGADADNTWLGREQLRRMREELDAAIRRADGLAPAYAPLPF